MNDYVLNTVQENHPTVLIVDDDPSFRFLVRQTLEQDGFVTEEAEDGAQAVCVFQELKPDIVLLDVVMPEMDGFDVCRAIRDMPNGLNVPIVMITSLKDVKSVNKSFQVGATDFLTKPVDWHLLSLRVQFLLRANHDVLHIVNKVIQGNAKVFEALKDQSAVMHDEIADHVRHLEQSVGTQILHELLETINSAVKDVQDDNFISSHSLKLVQNEREEPVEDSKLLNMRLQELQLNHSFVDDLLTNFKDDLSQKIENAHFYFKEQQFDLMISSLIQLKGIAEYLGAKKLRYFCEKILTLPGQDIHKQAGDLLKAVQEAGENVIACIVEEIDTKSHALEIE